MRYAITYLGADGKSYPEYQGSAANADAALAMVTGSENGFYCIHDMTVSWKHSVELRDDCYILNGKTFPIQK